MRAATPSLRLAALVAVSLPAAAGAGVRADDPTSALLDGVTAIAAPGTPSPLAAWSEDAFVVLVGNAGKGLKAPAVVAGSAGRGRFVALPHNGYASADTLAIGETGRFLVNAVKWCGGGRQPLRVAALGAPWTELLRAAGCEARELGARPLIDELRDADVVAGLPPAIGDAEIEALDAFLRGGGGIVAGQCAWGWMQVERADSLDANPLNRLFSRHGVAWTAGYLGKVGEVGFTAEREPPKLAHASAALTYLNNHRNQSSIKLEATMLLASSSVTALVSVLPRDDRILRPRLVSIATATRGLLVPSPLSPFPRIRGGERAMLAFLMHEAEHAPPEEVGELAAARAFPGETPAAAPRVTRKVEIDCSIPRWRSTGLYAAAGDVITVTLPEGRGTERGGLVLQIGAHTDELFDLDEWKRAPRVVRRIPLDSLETKAASAFGGPIYVDVPPDCVLPASDLIEIEIAGAVESPWFVLDRTSNDEWNRRLRQLPGPWAELESAKIIVTVPSATIRALGDPELLMRTWDRIADAAADLVGRPRARSSPERFVADVQISAGYMHAGYPIMTHLDAAARMADPAQLLAGDWGLFHELGHNHQEPDWTFEGTGEVTNNVICLYILETVCGKPPRSGHEGVEGGAALIAKHFEAGAPFEAWKSEPFLALQTYLQVQEAFGWEPFKKSFSDYVTMSRRDRPRTDDDKRDLWLVTLSRACGRNLGPFFTAWNVPTSEKARASVAELPPWMPEGFPPGS